MNDENIPLTCADCKHWSNDWIAYENRSLWCKHQRSEDFMRYILTCIAGEALVSAEDCPGFEPGKQEILL